MADADPKEIRDQFRDDTAEWQDIRDDGDTDIRYVSGDPWPAVDRKAREDAGRPCLSLDELNQYLNNAINDIRANKRGVKVTPIGSGATDDTASLRQSLIRQIEYRSNANQAYTTMFENALQRSFGFLRVKAQFVEEQVTQPTVTSFNQELLIQPIVNPNLVTPDPYGIRTDLADCSRLFYRESRDVEDFKREFPKAKIQSFTTEHMTQAADWVTKTRIWLAEYWVKERTGTRTLLMLKPQPATTTLPQGMPPGGGPLPPPQPVIVWKDELDRMPPSDQVWKERAVDQFAVKQYLTNGLEILKKTDWPGASIPFVSCYGKVLYVDFGSGSKRQILSMVRLARDPYLLYCYYRTCQAELVGQMPRTPLMAYEGQFSPDQLEEVKKSLHEPVAVLFAKATTEATGPQVLPLPQRAMFEPAIQSLEMGAEGARRAIQAAIGSSPLPTDAQRQNQKSGVALQKIAETTQKGTFHFTDHYDEAVTRTGQILEELIPHYYDTARDITVRKPDDSPQVVRINDPSTAQPGAAYPRTDTGSHDVTISTGPSFESEREAASSFADQIVGNGGFMQLVGPQKGSKLLALAIKLRNVGPFGDEMAETIDPKPPQQGVPPTPQQTAQQLQQLQGENEQMKQALQKAGMAMQTDQAKQQATMAKAKIDAQTTLQQARLAADKELALQVMKNAASIAVAHIGASAKGASLDAHAAEEAQALGGAMQQQAHDQAHDVAMAAQDHAHQLQQAQQAHDQALEQGDQEHQQALDQGDQAHQQALEQGQQEADLAPPPAAPAPADGGMSAQ